MYICCILVEGKSFRLKNKRRVRSETMENYGHKVLLQFWEKLK